MPNNIVIFQNKEELLIQARKQADKVDKAQQHSVYLYFITRYFVSLFEGRFGKIPIQVWNEYRNALDHYFRHLTNQDTKNLAKMEGHLQRAALDIMKIYCHKVQDKLLEQKAGYKTEVLHLVDNGSFYSKLVQGISSSEELFVQAKIDDSSLGEDAKTNQDILNKYIEALFAYDTIDRNFIKRI